MHWLGAVWHQAMNVANVNPDRRRHMASLYQLLCYLFFYSMSQEICTRFFALLCFVVVIHWLIFPYPSVLLHWHCGNLTIAPVPAKQPWLICINTSCAFIMNDCITTTKQTTTKPCAYFLGYTVFRPAQDIWTPSQYHDYALRCSYYLKCIEFDLWCHLRKIKRRKYYRKTYYLFTSLVVINCTRWWL